MDRKIMVMKRILLFLLFAVSFNLSEGRENDPLKEIVNSGSQIRQKPETDRLLAEWLADEGIAGDTIFAYLYRPAGCPRCESALERYSRKLKACGRKFVLITVYEDKLAAIQYNKENGYVADYYIYDTADRYKDIFNFNDWPDLMLTYVLKITKEGRMITGYDGNFYTKVIFDGLLESSEPLAYKDYGVSGTDNASDMIYPISMAGAEAMDVWKDFLLDVSSDVPLTETLGNPYFSGDVFFYPDRLLNGVEVYGRQTGTDVFTLKKVMRSLDSENDMFVSIDSASLKDMKDNNEIHYMLCNSGMLDDAHIGMSYSLPNIFFDAPKSIAYYNKACILSRRLADFSSDSCTALDIDVLNGMYMYVHFNFSSTGDKIIIGCKKLTWPMPLDTLYYKGRKGLDPFMPGFYDGDNPFMAAFDRRTGKLLFHFGNLDGIARKTSSSYAFVTPLSAVGGGELVYTDSYSGKVYVADTANVAVPTASYTVFTIDDAMIPKADVLEPYSDKVPEAYKGLFCRMITDLRITPDKLYCVIRYGDASDTDDARTGYTFVVIDRKTGKKEEYLYPKVVDGYKVFTKGLYESEQSVHPFEVLKNGSGKAVLRVYLKN